MNILLVTLVNVPVAKPVLRLRNGALYKHIPSGLIVRVRSHSALKAAVTHHSDNATVVLRSTLALASESEYKGYLAVSKLRQAIRDLLTLLVS